MSSSTSFCDPGNGYASNDFLRNLEEHSSESSAPTASAAMAKVRMQIDRIAKVDVPVLLLGETGVGKEVAARLIHDLSPRRIFPFLKVNCAALPSELLESELFGYEAGAFTGAVRSKPGRFELCHKGTILLDEIGEMSTSLQAKLLEVLQSGEFSRLGGRSTVKVDVRVLAATNIDIEGAMINKQFRPDLYYRLNAFCVRIPALRERTEDIPLLLDYFVEQIASGLGLEAKSVSPLVLHACQRYSWPGNVRELENFVKRYVILDDEESALLDLRDVDRRNPDATQPSKLQAHAKLPADLKSTLRELKAEAEKEAIVLALRKTLGCRKQAASLLKISGKALHYKIRQYGLARTWPVYQSGDSYLKPNTGCGL